MKVTIRLQHFNILGYRRIAILQYIANYLFLQWTLTVGLEVKLGKNYLCASYIVLENIRQFSERYLRYNLLRTKNLSTLSVVGAQLALKKTTDGWKKN